MLLQDPSLLLSKAIVIGEQVVAQDGSTFEVLGKPSYFCP